MPTLLERDQVGKRESLADLIANVEVQATPFCSMVQKRKRPNQVLHDWQVKAYPTTGHRGVLDNQDASTFEHNPRERIQSVAQKSWWNPSVSDFSEESVVAGVPKGEMASQIADALVTVKRKIERRCLSDEDVNQDDGINPNETRGAFSWVDDSAQATFPVPAAFRTPADSIYTGAVADLGEDDFNALMESAYKERKGPSYLHGFCGVELKRQLSNFTRYDDTAGGQANVRQFNQDAKDRAVINVIDKLVLDTGEVDLLLSSFLLTNRDTGADTLATHKSGLFLDMSMWGLAYTRMPRVVKLPYEGGGYKAIVDTIFLLMCDNPLGHVKVETTT